MLTHSETPNSLNPPNGWIQNTNNWPYSSAGPDSPNQDDYPRYMDMGSENFRGVHAIAVLGDCLAGQGGNRGIEVKVCHQAVVLFSFWEHTRH